MTDYLMTGLKPCPFCGGTDLYCRHKNPKWVVTCKGCWIDGPDSPSWSLAIAAWNRRAGEEGEAITVSPERQREIRREIKESLGGYTTEDDY